MEHFWGIRVETHLLLLPKPGVKLLANSWQTFKEGSMTKTNQILLMGYWITKTNICWKTIHWWIIRNKACTCIKQVNKANGDFIKSFSISGTPFCFIYPFNGILWDKYYKHESHAESNLWDAEGPETPLWFPHLTPAHKHQVTTAFFTSIPKHNQIFTVLLYSPQNILHYSH